MNIVCSRVSEGGCVIEGSTRGKCHKCRQPVWVAPATQTLLDHPEAVLWCSHCGFKIMSQQIARGEGVNVVATEETVEEARNAIQKNIVESN